MAEGRLGRFIDGRRSKREADAVAAMKRGNGKGKAELDKWDISINAARLNPPTSIVRFLLGGDITLLRAVDRLERKGAFGSRTKKGTGMDAQKVYWLKRRASY